MTPAQWQMFEGLLWLCFWCFASAGLISVLAGLLAIVLDTETDKD